MEFVRLLTPANCRELFNNGSVEAKVDAVVRDLQNSVIVVANNLYIIDTETMTWTKQESLNDVLTSAITCFIGRSIDAYLTQDPDFYNWLEDEEEVERKQFFNKIRKEPVFAKLLIFKTKLTLPNICTDDDKFAVHFKNGRFDLSNFTFSPRDPYRGNTIITKCLPYDFSEVTKDEVQSFIDKFLNPIFREGDMGAYFLYYMYKSLIGVIESTRPLLFFYGEGKCGKSTLMKMIERTFDHLVYNLAPDSFDSDAKAGRVMGSVAPYHRFLIWNDPTPLKKTSAFLKNVCDGSITATKLYRNGNEKTIINATLFVTANKIYKFDSDKDSGIGRRFLYYRCKNRFVEENADPAQFTFPLTDFPFTDHDKVIVFNAIALHAKFSNYAAGVSVAIPSVLVSGLNIIDFKKFAKYFLVGQSDGNIQKDDMIYCVKKAFPFYDFGNKPLTEIVEELKLLGINYDESKQSRSILANNKSRKGSFAGVSFNPMVLNIFNPDVKEFDITELP
jgi:hypothetical protein